ncbi:MAG: 30S ribosomal protein S4 [Promethearchaeota archaeon]
MGDTRRLKKKYKTPNRPWERTRIDEELTYIGRYGLRNKKELWKHQSQLRRFRQIARELRALSGERQEKGLRELVGKLYRLGIVPDKSVGIEEILSLNVEDVLNRRLQSVVLKKGLAKTIYQARQLITHGHIAINDGRINAPGHLVRRDEEETVNYFFSSPYANPDHKMRGDIVLPTDENEA